MEKKREFEGVVQPMHETYGWCVQCAPNPQANDRGLRSAADLLQRHIGQRVRITIEVLE